MSHRLQLEKKNLNKFKVVNEAAGNKYEMTAAGGVAEWPIDGSMSVKASLWLVHRRTLHRVAQEGILGRVAAVHELICTPNTKSTQLCAF